jgi:peptidoglycan/LPS O-acetylase OafA/YrhL
MRGFTEFKAKQYFAELDGLRALAILLVLFHHSPRMAQGNPLQTLRDNGRYGVAFFFVISGFLICTLFLREQEKTGRIHLMKFYGRRCLRLLPLYYAALALQIVLVFVLHQYSPENRHLFATRLPSYLFYYCNWLPNYTSPPFFCAWSLAVEEQFYLAFGLLIFFGPRRQVVILAAAALILKICAFQFFGPLDAGAAVWRVVFSYREPILLGVLIAFVLNQRRFCELCGRWLSSAWVRWGIAVSAVVWTGFHEMGNESSWDSLLLYALMGVILTGAVLHGAPLLSGRLMTHVGKVSYGIYLLHMFVFSSVRKFPGGNTAAGCFFVGGVVTIAIASLSYRYFERPIINSQKAKLRPTAEAREPATAPISEVAQVVPVPVVVIPSRPSSG